MNAFLWTGIALALAGLAGILWCLRRAAWIRSAGLSNDRAMTELRKLVAVNVAAVGVAFAGLAVLTVGLILG